MTKKNPESSSSRRRPTSISSSFKAQNPGLKWKPLLLSGDKFMQIVKLEGEYLDHTRFLCIVNHRDEFCLLGVDEDIKEIRAQPTIGKKWFHIKLRKFRNFFVKSICENLKADFFCWFQRILILMFTCNFSRQESIKIKIKDSKIMKMTGTEKIVCI